MLHILEGSRVASSLRQNESRGAKALRLFVFHRLKRATEAGAAVAVCLAGGYAVRSEDTVEIHCNSVRAAEALIQ